MKFNGKREMWQLFIATSLYFILGTSRGGLLLAQPAP